ncbi:MAG: hypothetical protein PHN88_07610 [Ignavibacteria bacterium]|nr:hypothetical protein [Ignavibacteria bacterium]
MYNLDNYIGFLKEKLDSKFFSPLLIKLANLYFFNDQFDNCIKICDMVNELFPYYLSPKILKIKALIKLEYFNEAENELNSITNRIPNKELTELLYSSLEEFKNKQSQAKIFYPEMLSDLDKFEDYSEDLRNIPHCKSISEQTESELLLIDSDYLLNLSNEDNYQKFVSEVNNITLTKFSPKKSESGSENGNGKAKVDHKETMLSNVKIITETIADILVKQGLYKEAFDAYTFLLRAGHKNKRKILEKIAELERRM